MKEKILKESRKQVISRRNSFTKGTLTTEKRNAKENIQEAGKKTVYNNSYNSYSYK